MGIRTPEEIVRRAKIVVAAADTDYHLKWPNGGVNPLSLHPGADSPDEDIKWLDCAGFVAWATGYPRKLPGFPSTPSIKGNYVNTDSMYEEASGFVLKGVRYPAGQFFRKLDRPRLGCIVVYHSRRIFGQFSCPFNPSIGHTGIVSWVHPSYGLLGQMDSYEGWFSNIKVIHCSSGNNKKFGRGRAVAETSGSIWKGKKSLFLEYIGG